MQSKVHAVPEEEDTTHADSAVNELTLVTYDGMYTVNKNKLTKTSLFVKDALRETWTVSFIFSHPPHVKNSSLQNCVTPNTSG
ncbi:Uu.00g100770.m01.CDS01 [Anthostomella pinea]|uniref:Uu.00g100770.m01.CDS01 n=1 Tax=Anthostomella pinea TaxID=933095 RepID=A0AAI8YFD0_9PEZI|nr:Uu.00g100770.m01.CDS01 [Anthostomella pinea]